MNGRDFIKLVSVAGTTSLGSGCFSGLDRPNVLSSKTEVFSPAGIRWDPEAPGFKNVILRPEPVKSVDWVKCSFNSPYRKSEQKK
jgi:hypothetical protein